MAHHQKDHVRFGHGHANRGDRLFVVDAPRWRHRYLGAVGRGRSRVIQRDAQDDVAAALGGRRSGKCWRAKCPAHDDNDPSLSITQADDGRVLVYCFAGCDQAAVLSALEDLGVSITGGGANRTVDLTHENSILMVANESLTELSADDEAIAEEARESINEAWPKPEPLWDPVQLRSDYPTDALGPMLGRAARDLEEVVQAPLALCANALLGVAALVVQGHADLTLPHGQTCPLSLFFLTVAHSGERKSAIDRIVMRAVVAKEKKAMENLEEEAKPEKRIVKGPCPQIKMILEEVEALEIKVEEAEVLAEVKKQPISLLVWPPQLRRFK